MIQHSTKAILISSLLAFSSTCLFAENLSIEPIAVEVEVQPDKVGAFKVMLNNKSDQEVSIVSITTSCTCTIANLEGDPVILPGGSRIIKGVVNFAGRLGRYENDLIVESKSNGMHRKGLVKVRANVSSPLVFNEVDFGAIESGGERRIMSALVNRGNSNLNWVGLISSSDSEQLCSRVEKVGEGKYRVVIEIDPLSLPISTFRSAVRLTLLDEKGQKLPQSFDLPISADVVGPLIASPRSIYLGAVSPGAIISRKVVVSSKTLDLHTAKVELQPGWVTSELRQTPNGVEITASCIAKESAGVFSGKLILNAGKQTRLSVPIVGYVREKP